LRSWATFVVLAFCFRLPSCATACFFLVPLFCSFTQPHDTRMRRVTRERQAGGARTRTGEFDIRTAGWTDREGGASAQRGTFLSIANHSTAVKMMSTTLQARLDADDVVDALLLGVLVDGAGAAQANGEAV